MSQQGCRIQGQYTKVERVPTSLMMLINLRNEIKTIPLIRASKE